MTLHGNPRSSRRRARWTVVLGAALGTLVLCAVLAQTAAAELHPNARQGWLVGFSGGGGTLGGEGGSDREGGGAGSFRVGYAFNPQLSLELNSNAWTKEESGVRLTFSTSTAALNYYPGESGLVLRGGLGLGTGKFSASSGGSSVTVSESGFGLNAGVGYEFRVLRTFALGPQVDFSWTSIDETSFNWVNFALGFNWYFIPQ